MAGDDDVVLKVTSDVASGIDGLKDIEKEFDVLGDTLKTMADDAKASADALAAYAGTPTKAVEDFGKATEDAAEKTTSFWSSLLEHFNASGVAAVTWGVQMSKAFDSLADGVKGAVTGFPNLVKEVAHAGDEMATMSNRLGVSVENLAELQFMSKQSGASMDGMARAIQGLAGNLNDTSSKAAQAITAMGLPLEKLQAEDPKQAFLEIIKGIQDTVPASQQGAKAMEIFGSRFRGSTMLLKENIDELQKDFQHLGGGMTSEVAKMGDDYSDNMNRITQAQENFRQHLASAVLPTVNKVLHAMPELGGAVLSVGSTIWDAAQKFLPLLANLALMRVASAQTAVAQTAQAAATTAVGAASGAAVAPTLSFAGAVRVLTAALGPLAIAVTAVIAAVTTWKKANEETGWIRDLSDNVEYLALRAQGYSAAEAEASIAGQHASQVMQEQEERVKRVTAAWKAAHPPIAAAKDVVAALNEQVAQTRAEMASLEPDQRAAIKSFLDIGKSTKETAEALGLGISVVDLYKKSMEDATKASKEAATAAEKTPYGKITKTFEELKVAIADADKTGMSAQRMLDEFGKKAFEASQDAELVDGALAKMPERVAAIGAAFGAQDIAKKTSDFAKVLQGGLFDALKNTPQISADQMFGGMTDALEHVKKLSTELSRAFMTDQQKRLDILKTDEEAELKAAEHRIGVTNEVRQQEIDLIRKDYAVKRALELQATADFELNMRLKGVKTKAALQEDLDKQLKFFADMLAHREKFNEAEIKAEEEKTKKMAQAALGGEEAWAAEHNVKTKAKYDEDLQTQQETLKHMLEAGLAYNNAEIAQQRDRVKAAKEAGGAIKQDWKSSLQEMSQAWSQLSQIMGDKPFGKFTASVAEAVGSLNVMVTGIDGFKKSWSEIGTNKQGGVKGIASMFEGITGKPDAQGKGGGILGSIGGMVKGLGGMVPLIGQAIQGVTMAIQVGKKLWDAFTTSQGEKMQKDIARDFTSAGGTALKVSEEFGDKLAKSAKELFKGDRFSAEIYNLNTLIKEAGGLSEKNFGQMTARLGDVFKQVQNGHFTVEQATKVLDENFSEFAKHVTETGKIASKQFTDLIRQNAEMGTQSKEIATFVGDQTTRLGGALTKLMGPQAKALADYKAQATEITDKLSALDKNSENYGETQAKLTAQLAFLNTQTAGMWDKAGGSMERFERLAVAGFNSAVKAGVPFIDALEQMGPAFDSIIAQNEVLGRTGGAAIQELLKFREVASANKELVESAGALNEMMLALSNTGALNADTMADLEAQGNETFTQLTEAGFTEQQSLQQMKGFLESVRDAHKQLGIPIDENTQALINQAEASGVLSKEQVSTNQLMMDGLGAIIKALKGDLPDSFKTMAKSATDAAKTSAAAMGTVDKSAAGVQTSLANTDWSGWSEAAVNAAKDAQAAVDGVTFGTSPGGIKEIPIKLKEAIRAFQQFEAMAVDSATSVKDAVDAVSPDVSKAVTAGDDADARQADLAIQRQAQMMQGMGGGGVHLEEGAVMIDRPILKDRQSMQDLAVEVAKQLKRAVATTGAWT